MRHHGERVLRDLIGKLAVLHVDCIRCGRTRQYDVARLIAELGPDFKLNDWLNMSTADCQRRNANGGGSCSAIMPDLIELL